VSPHWLGNIVGPHLLDPEVGVVGRRRGTMFQPVFGEIKNRIPSWVREPERHMRFRW